MVSGIDILEVMNDLDDRLLLDARCYKKSSPVWLKIAAMAACFCCAVLMGILFADRFAKDTDVPETLASVLEETVSNTSVFENAGVVHSEAYDLDLLVPGEYAEAIEIDTPYIFTYKYITEVITLDHAAFSFAYSVENEIGTGGYLWTICVYPKEEYDWSFLERFEENTYLLNKLVLATDDTYVYELNYPDAYVQFDIDDYESTLSYYRHAMVGYEMLSDFVERNGLDAAENGLKKYGDYINETVRTTYDAFIPDSAEIVRQQAELLEELLTNALETVGTAEGNTEVETEGAKNPPLRAGGNYSFADQHIPTYEELVAKPDIKVVDIRGDSHGTYKEQRKDFLNSSLAQKMYSNPVVNRDTGELVHIVPATFTHTFSNYGADQIAAVKKLPEIIESSVLTHAERSRAEADDHTTGVYTLFGAVRTDSGVQPVKLKVKEYRLDGQELPETVKAFISSEDTEFASAYDNRVLVLESIEKESTSSSAASSNAFAQPDNYPSVLPTISVAELYNLVNDEYKKYLPAKEAAQHYSFSDDEYTATYNRTAILKEETIDRYLRDYAAKGTPNYAQAYIAYMDPDDFLSLTTSMAGRYQIEDESRTLNEEEFTSQQVPIQLWINHETGEVEGHEGRHRCVALRDAGIEKVPVLMFDSSNKYNKEPISIIRLHGQFNRYAQSYVHDMLPLSYGNRDEVIQKFGTQPSSERFYERYRGQRTLRYSISDEEYLDAVTRGDTETAQRMVDEVAIQSMPDTKIKGEDGSLTPVYHGTKDMFFVFDTSVKGGVNGTAEGFGIYTSDDPEVTAAYGDRQLKMYANITRPATSTEITITRKELVELIESTCKAEAQKWVDEGDYDSLDDALRDTWVSNYVYTYDISMNRAYREVANTILNGEDGDMGVIQEVMMGMGIRDYAEATEFYRNSLIPITGFDGFVTQWKNQEAGKFSNIILALDSNQLKSADAVTYDDNGNVIPLSERFNAESSDIRYSFSDDDTGDATKITAADVEILRQIGRKSINDFSSEEIQKAEPWARKFYSELGEKSPFFRAWFGDWRSNDTSLIQTVQATKAGTAPAGKAINSDTQEAISWDRQFFREAARHQRSGGVVAEVSGNISEIIEKAIYFDTSVSLPTSKSKMENTAFMHHLYALVGYGDATYLEKLYVEEAMNNKGTEVFSRAYTLKDIKKVAPIPNSVLSHEGGLTGGTGTTTVSVSDLWSLVKQYDPEFSPREASKVVEENGFPKIMFHGTSSYGFDFFDTYSSNFGLFGYGSYFTDNPDVADSYQSKGKGTSPGTYAVYLNIKNPMDMDAPMDSKWIELFQNPDIDLDDFYLDEAQTNEDAFKALKECLADQGYSSWEAKDTISEMIQGMGFDGITHIGGGRYGVDDGTRHQVYIAFEPEQIKSVDNIGTFDGNNPMMRYSLSEEDGEQGAKKPATEGGGWYDGKSLIEDKEVYSYNFLAALPPMEVTELPNLATLKNASGKIDRSAVVEQGMKNAKAIGYDRNELVFVKNRYTGRDVAISKSAIRHGLNGEINRMTTNARLGAKIGEIVQRAVPINALENKAEEVAGTYAMVAYATDDAGREIVAVITVEQRESRVVEIFAYDAAHAVSGRIKKGSQVDTKSQGFIPIKATTISIANLLEAVNNTYQSILSEDVLNHFKETRNPAGYYSESARFSLSNDDADWILDNFGNSDRDSGIAAPVHLL